MFAKLKRPSIATEFSFKANGNKKTGKSAAIAGLANRLEDLTNKKGIKTDIVVGKRGRKGVRINI